VPGKVIARLVDTGQVVKAEQPLMRIDATDYTNAIAVQAGGVAAARPSSDYRSGDELGATDAFSRRPLSLTARS